MGPNFLRDIDCSWTHELRGGFLEPDFSDSLERQDHASTQEPIVKGSVPSSAELDSMSRGGRVFITGLLGCRGLPHTAERPTGARLTRPNGLVFPQGAVRHG